MELFVKKFKLDFEPLIPLKTAIAERYMPISESNFYEGVSAGKYPPPIKIGNRYFLTETILRNIRGETVGGSALDEGVANEDQ